MDERNVWQVRPAMTAAIGLVAAVLIQQLVDRHVPGGPWTAPAPGRVSLATAIGVAGILAIFTIERVRWAWSAAFAALGGVVAGLILWWSGPFQPNGEFLGWRTACLFLAIAVAAPLFQTARDAGRARFDYVEVHGHVWTNLVLWGAACAFTGVAFALTYLLAALFSLIGIHVLRDLLEHGWANAAIAGAAFGGAAGLFRERDAVVRTMQRVVTAVLAVLAPVLGAGLLLFLIALPFTGLDALWDATKATTPILLACVIGSFVLVNAVIGDGEEDARNRILHWGAMALGLAMLPLAVIALIGTNLRIGQYGFTPDRLWALTFVIVACTYGAAYLVALLRWRQGWAVPVRRANLALAFGLCGLALLLATPIVSFNAIATRDQVARLEGGRTAPDRFDWAALAFDFGEPGKAALRRLTRSANAPVAKLAQSAARATSRYQIDGPADLARRDAVSRSVRVLPVAAPLPAGLAALLPDWNVCGDTRNRGCVVLYRAGAAEAVAIAAGCVAAPSADPTLSGCQATRLMLADGRWQIDERRPRYPGKDAMPALRAAAARGAIEVRPVTRRQVFVGDTPVGEVFE